MLSDTCFPRLTFSFLKSMPSILFHIIENIRNKDFCTGYDHFPMGHLCHSALSNIQMNPPLHLCDQPLTKEHQNNQHNSVQHSWNQNVRTYTVLTTIYG